MKECIINVNNISFQIVLNDKKEISSLKYCEHKRKETKNLSSHAINLKKNLEEYFTGKRKNFRVPIEMPGSSDFGKSVYKHLINIPYGKKITYKELAKKSGSPKAYRAVGTLCRKNPLPFLIPCHRVLATNGLGGYSLGIEKKKELLALENKWR